jgi:hypothetical protein
MLYDAADESAALVDDASDQVLERLAPFSAHP